MFDFFFSVFWLVCINIPLNLFYLVEGTKEFTNSSSSKSFVYNINRAIDWIFSAALNVSIHILILVSTNDKWKTLWEKFQLLQEYIGDEGRFYRQLRHHTIQGLMIFSVVNIGSTYQDLL